MNFVDAIKNCFVKYVEFRGRASRAEFWYFALFCLLLVISADILDAAIVKKSYWSTDRPLFGPLFSVSLLLTSLPFYSVGARRLHDVGKSGWWQLIYVTGIGYIPLIIWSATPSQNVSNKFGDPTHSNASDYEPFILPKWVQFFVIPVCVVIVLFLFCVAILQINGLIPDNTKVTIGANLKPKTTKSFFDLRILEEQETILYYYTDDLFSFTRQGQILTERGVTSYATNEYGIIDVVKMKFDEIEKIETVQEASYSNYGVYKIYGKIGAEYEWFDILLPQENNELFLMEIENRIN